MQQKPFRAEKKRGYNKYNKGTPIPYPIYSPPHCIPPRCASEGTEGTTLFFFFESGEGSFATTNFLSRPSLSLDLKIF